MRLRYIVKIITDCEDEWTSDNVDASLSEWMWEAEWFWMLGWVGKSWIELICYGENKTVLLYNSNTRSKNWYIHNLTSKYLVVLPCQASTTCMDIQSLNSWHIFRFHFSFHMLLHSVDYIFMYLEGNYVIHYQFQLLRNVETAFSLWKLSVFSNDIVANWFQIPFEV